MSHRNVTDFFKRDRWRRRLQFPWCVPSKQDKRKKMRMKTSPFLICSSRNEFTARGLLSRRNEVFKTRITNSYCYCLLIVFSFVVCLPDTHQLLCTLIFVHLLKPWHTTEKKCAELLGCLTFRLETQKRLGRLPPPWLLSRVC